MSGSEFGSIGIALGDMTLPFGGRGCGSANETQLSDHERSFGVNAACDGFPGCNLGSGDERWDRHTPRVEIRIDVELFGDDESSGN